MYTHFIHFLLEYIWLDYELLRINLLLVLWIKFLWILKFGINLSFIWIFIAKWWVRMFNTNLKISLLAIFWHSHWSCWCCRSLLFLGMKNPGTLASHNCTKDPLPCNKVIGVMFSLIVIMLQAKFLFVRVHSLMVSNILCEKI